MVSRAVVFNIDQCDPVKAAVKGEKCKTPTEITTYVKDVMLEAWVAFKKMDFLDREGETTFKVSDLFFS